VCGPAATQAPQHNPSSGCCSQLRLLFEAQGLPSNPTAEEEPNAKDVVSVIQHTLKTIASEQERVIKDVCMANSIDISQCVGEVSTMHVAVDDIKTVLIGGNEALHAAGSSLIQNARELDEMLEMQQSLNQGSEALAAAKQVMSLCTEVGSAQAQQAEGCSCA
jgi:hypothetical protein